VKHHRTNSTGRTLGEQGYDRLCTSWSAAAYGSISPVLPHDGGVTDEPDKPWSGGAWEHIEVKGPPRWHGWVARPLVAVFILILVIPLVTTVVWMVRANTERQETRALLYSNLLDGYTAGTCVNKVTVAGWNGVQETRCDTPHDGEVTAVVNLPSGSYPGPKAVMKESSQLCDAATDDWLVDGPGADLDLDVSYFYPLEGGWSTTGATTVCFVTQHSGDKVTGHLARQE